MGRGRPRPPALLPLLLALLAPPAPALQHGGPARPLYDRATECLGGKKVFFAGNSISRGIYFALAALLENSPSYNTSEALWRDRRAQKELCMWGPLGMLSCQYKMRDTMLVYSMTQRLESLEEKLQKAFQRFQPDVVVMEVGMDHTCYQYEVDETGLRGFERNLDSEFDKVAAMMEGYHAERGGSRFVWRAVSHFNETNDWDPAWKNTYVDLWNTRLHGHLQRRGLLDQEWLNWYPKSAELIDRALARTDGFAMEDWIHPDSHTLLQLISDLLPSLCP